MCKKKHTKLLSSSDGEQPATHGEQQNYIKVKNVKYKCFVQKKKTKEKEKRKRVREQISNNKNTQDTTTKPYILHNTYKVFFHFITVLCSLNNIRKRTQRQEKRERKSLYFSAQTKAIDININIYGEL